MCIICYSVSSILHSKHGHCMGGKCVIGDKNLLAAKILHRSAFKSAPAPYLKIQPTPALHPQPCSPHMPHTHKILYPQPRRVGWVACTDLWYPTAGCWIEGKYTFDVIE